jgi:hypothetical protein
MPGKQRAGAGSRIRIGGAVNLNGNSWDCDRTGDDLDTTNFESQGEEEGIIGVKASPFNYSGDWDAGANWFGNPPGIFVRADGPSHQFFFSVADNTGILLPGVRLLSTRNSAQVRGKVTFNASGRSQGSAGIPSVSTISV